MKKKKICIVIGSAMNLNSLYKDQFKFLMENGYEITGVAPAGIEHEWLRKDGVKTKIIHLKRPPSPLHDLFSLIQLTWFFIFNRFDIVSVSTPKASLIGAIAAVFTFQKNIFYTLRGRAYEMTTGRTRKFYEMVEKLVCKVSVKVFCISKELRVDIIKKRLCDPKKIFVIGSGSSNGVDLKRFTPSAVNSEKGKKIRKKFNLRESDMLILYSGRIRKDKGVNELVIAFNSLSKKHSNIYLLIQGKYEVFNLLEENVLEVIKNHERIYEAGWEKNIENFYSASDVFAFPSHREGFGNVAIEASAMEIPVIGFNVIGCRESIKNGVSGILCDDFSVESLEKGLNKLIENPVLRGELGRNGRKRVEEEFDSIIIWEQLLKVYNIILDPDWNEKEYKRSENYA